jgi:outer membrane receptor protein involved in Fe transport
MLLAYSVTSNADVTSRNETYRFNIPRQQADLALTLFAEQANLTLIVPFDAVRNKTANSLLGEYPLEEAVNILLEGTGLRPTFSNHVVLNIATADQSDANGGNMKPKDKPKDKTRVGALIASIFLTSNAVAQDVDEATGQRAIEEIVVTASKRSESIQDVASSISAVTGEEIARRGLVGMDDYLRSIPGVSNIDRGVASNMIVIRGVTADGQNYTDMGGTVGLYFGDVPLSGYATFGNNVDVKLVDMQRVEVLRGPQGTLYGDGSLGGTVRNIPNPPDLSEVDGSLKVGYSHTQEEGGSNNELQGMINLPLVEDRFALRFVGYRFDDGGYVNNIAASDPAYSANATSLGFDYLLLDQEDVGNSKTAGGRVSALWQATDRLQATLILLRQDVEQDGFSEVQLGLGNFEQTRLQFDERYGGGSERIRDDLSIANLEVQYDLGWSTFHSSTSYIDEQGLFKRDVGSFFGGQPSPQTVDSDSTAFVEELRLASQLEGKMQFLAAAYYNDSVRDRFSDAFTQGTPDTEFQLDGRGREASSEQKALFGELSYDITEGLRATAGMRAFEYDQKFVTVDFLTPEPTTSIIESRNRTGQTYKFNVTYSPGDESLFYGQYSEGFRLGAPLSGPPPSVCDIDNDGLIDGTNLPSGDRQLDPDSLESYEIGTKLTVAGGRGRVGASIYHNDWVGIPVVVLVPCGFGQFVNAGEAQTEGIELESEWALFDTLRLSLSASYVDAELTKDAPGIGQKGDRLPGSPRYNVNAGVQYDFDYTNRPGFVRADILRVGGFYNNLAGTGTEIGDYTAVNLRGGIVLGRVGLEVFIKNATNTDELTWLDSVFAGTDARASRLRPRTIGLSVGYQF